MSCLSFWYRFLNMDFSISIFLNSTFKLLVLNPWFLKPIMKVALHHSKFQSHLHNCTNFHFYFRLWMNKSWDSPIINFSIFFSLFTQPLNHKKVCLCCWNRCSELVSEEDDASYSLKQSDKNYLALCQIICLATYFLHILIHFYLSHSHLFHIQKAIIHHFLFFSFYSLLKLSFIRHLNHIMFIA